jgi:acetoin utilization deacetylase AcuC-like enzyme
MTTVLISHTDCLGHITPGAHPERLERLISINNSLDDLDDPNLIRLEAPLGKDLDILRAHSKQYLENLKKSTPSSGVVSLDADTFMSEGSLMAARRGVGGIIKGVDLVLGGEVANAFVITRPPGHHAEKERAMGFCLFGNVASAAKYALDHHQLSKVAIVDFDVHHGNGTQDILWDEERVLFVSSHQMPLFPGTGYASEKGIQNNILNIPLEPNISSQSFKALYEKEVFPALETFSPDLLLISAGFDAHASDPLANINLLEEDFEWLTNRLCDLAKKVCGGRVVSTLEGGYDLDALAASVRVHLETLLKRGKND